MVSRDGSMDEEFAPRERVELAFNLEEPDRVPVFEQAIAPNIASEVLGRKVYTGSCGNGAREVLEFLIEGRREEIVDLIARDLVELHLKLGLDIIRPPLVGTEPPARKLDNYTYVFEDRELGSWSILRFNPASSELMTVDSWIRREGIRAIVRLVEHMEDTGPSYEEEIFDVMVRVVDEVGDSLFIAGYGGIGIPLEKAWLGAMIRYPQVIERYLEEQLKRSKAMVMLCKKHGADFILGGGDLAGSTGPAYSPRLFRRLVLPRLRELVDFCHGMGLKYIFRTDGYIWPIARELLLESGVDGYGEIDASAGMDLADLKRSFPHLILWGNVDCARTLVYGPESAVRREVSEDIEKAASGGGYVLGSSNTIHPNAKARYFVAMVEAAKSYGKYPRRGSPGRDEAC